MAEKNLEYSGAYNFSMSQPKKGFVWAHLYNKCSLQNFVLHKRVKNTGCASKFNNAGFDLAAVSEVEGHTSLLLTSVSLFHHMLHLQK